MMVVRILVFTLLAWLEAFGQIPSNGARTVGEGSKLRTCASELERLITPATHAEDCLLDVEDAVYIEVGEPCPSHASIGPDGTIILPLIGKLQAAHLTISQLATSVNTLLSKFLDHPNARVTLADNGRQTRYFVDGDVLQRGRYLLLTPVTVLEAIDQASGFKNHKIRVVRESSSVLKLDYQHLLKHPEQNVSVQNGDHILLLSQ